ncbi:MAG: histidine phosphatase family protein, partial [Chloroflexota bacterium]|nr:histidine phosphatase family protein [Chloroflexota bacterium]
MRKLASISYSWIQVLDIYLRVGWRFWRWRIQLWLQHVRTTESISTGMKQTLLFIRHGQTVWNVEHRLPGQISGVALNDTGREQSERLGEALAVLPISAI